MIPGEHGSSDRSLRNCRAVSESVHRDITEDLVVRRFFASLLCLNLIVGLLLLAGCQQETDGTTPLAHSPSAPAPSGGTSSTKDRLLGRWDGSFQLSPKAPIDDFDEATINICKSIRMLVAFHADDRLQMSATMTLPEIGDQTTETSGNWSILAENGDEIRLQALDPDGDPEEISIVFQDDHTFTMIPPNELRSLGMLKFIKN
jgi:hypothetical protein